MVKSAIWKPPTQAWFPLRYHKVQRALWEDNEQFKVVVAGRGSGKSEIARRYLVRMTAVKKQWQDPLYFYALPTRDQAKKVAWDKIKALFPNAWIKDIYESEMIIKTVFGSQLWLIGMDKPQRAEGVQFDGGMCDESSDMKPEGITISIIPTLSHRTGFLWRIGVPKRNGVGAPHFKQAFEEGLTGTVPGMKSYTWSSADILTPQALATAAYHLDPKDFNEQYHANWETVGGTVFHAYDDVLNLSLKCEYDPTKRICVGSDFNVSPMSWVIGHRSKNGIDIFDELFIRDTNTQATLDTLYKKYGSNKVGWDFFGDATGAARKTSASESDYLQILNDKRFVNKQVYYLNSNPPRLDRFASCNAMFCNALGVRRLRVNPRCANLRKDLLRRAYKKDSRETDDVGDIGHITDALGYIVYRCFPLRHESGPTEAGIIEHAS